jgi:3-hydroxy-9,10-secoandrosta-1,3,5(10)-triene-9,17-dione monooxygenase
MTTEGEMTMTVAERLTDAPVEALSDAELIARARSLGELAWEHNAQTEADRRLPHAVIEALFDSGLLRLATSRRMGGLEAHPLTLVEVGRELARGSAALGWLYGLTTGHQWYLSFAHEQLQQEVRDSGPGLIVDSLVPGGEAEVVDDGYLLSGRWRFVSGVEWCSWAGLAFVPPGANPPRPVVAFVPAKDLTIEDTWRTVGLRGTASNEVVLERVLIPRHRIFELAKFAHDGIPQGEVVEPSTVFKLPFMGMAAIHLAYTSLGVAERAIEEFTHWTKVRVRAYEHTAAQEAPYSQLTLADAIVKWDAAHALMLQYVRDMWDAAEAGRVVLPDDVRGRMFAQRAYIARTCAELTNQLFLDSGAMSLFETSGMQQFWRDANAASMHMVLGRGDALTSFGRTLMGLPGHPFA